MKTNLYRSALVLFGALLLTACAAKGPVQPIPEFAKPGFTANDYTAKVDNFLIILDASSSMGELYNGNPKFVYAREVAHRLNQSIPELGQNSGLRSFGHSNSITRKPTIMVYGMETYSTEKFEAGLDTLHTPGGTSPLYKALDAAKKDLDGVVTKTAVVIITDGKDLAPETSACATALKEQLGSSVCFYPILVGDNARGAALMEEIAATGNCGFTSNADALLEGNGIKNFVETVFISKKAVAPAASKAPADSDHDGISDDLDKCPGTPAGVVVGPTGCPLDSDGDGVYDYLDKCPGTPAGIAVDSSGCPLDSDKDGVPDSKDLDSTTPAGASVNAQGIWIVKGLLFDFDKAVIKPSSYAELDRVTGILKKNPGLNVDLQGHTDSIGTPEYNQGLSVRRAKAVKAYLVKKGIAADRMTCTGFGLTKPVESNATAKGRALNRRVEIHLVK